MLPEVPIRHWVVSLPFQLRYLLGYHRTLCTQVMQAIAHELMRSYRRRAKRALGLPSIAQAHSGTVTFVQRFDSALRLCGHAHLLALDGVYLQEDDGGLTFHPLPEPTLADVHVCPTCQGAMKVTEVALTADSIATVMARHGLGPQPPPPTPRPMPGQLPLAWPPSP